MIKTVLKVLIFIFLSFLYVQPASAFWVWTPETGRWENPKYSVKGTPEEQLKYGLEFYQAKQYKEAIRELNKLIKNYPRARQAPDAQYYIGLSLEEQGRLFEAFQQYQTVIDKYPFSERSGEIVQKQYDIGEKLLAGINNKGKFMSAIAGTDYNVIEVFRKVIKNAPYGKLAAPSQYKIGLYLLEKQLYQEARDELEKVINDYPDSEWAKAAKYQIAVSDSKRSTGAQYDQQITKTAIEEFEDFVEVHPDAELTASAKEQIATLREKEAENNFVIGQFYEKRKNYSAAKIYYQTIVEEYQNTSFTARALERIRIVSGMTQ